MRRLVLSAVLLGGVVLTPLVTSASADAPPQRPNACTMVVSGTAGDGSAFSNTPGAPNDPDLDITGIRAELTGTSFLVTATVPGLTNHPLLGTGDLYALGVAADAKGSKNAYYGYLRDVAGSHPQQPSGGLYDNPDVAPTFDQVVPRYDLTGHTVTLEVPRRDLAAQLGTTSAAMVLHGPGMFNQLWSAGRFENFGDSVSARSFETISAKACDAFLAKTKVTPRCSATVIDKVADESPFQDDNMKGMTTTLSRDDDVDGVATTLALSKTGLTRSVRLARLQQTPMTGFGLDIASSLTAGGKTIAWSASQAITGSTGSFGSLPSKTTVDLSQSTVTSTVTRADLLKALGRADLKGLTLTLGPTTVKAAPAGTSDSLAGPSLKTGTC